MWSHAVIAALFVSAYVRDMPQSEVQPRSYPSVRVQKARKRDQVRRGIRRAPYTDRGGHRVLVMVNGRGEEVGHVSVDPENEHAVLSHLRAVLDLLDPPEPPFRII